MKRIIAAAGAVLAVGMLGACRDQPVAPTQGQAAIQPTQDLASLRIGTGPYPKVVKSHRTVLHGDIVHYTFDVAVGPGQYDVIRLHRVVRERRPNRPDETEDAVFLMPGAPNSFEMIFMEPLISRVPAWDQSVTAFLAENGIDVWGMDYAWALVPAGTTDFGFMRGWGLQREIQDVERALLVARSIRVSTGQGNDRLHVLGFSYGVWIAYAVAADETQQPRGRRAVEGIIPVDSYIKSADAAERAGGCDGVAQNQALLDAGTYQDGIGLFFQQVGNLAKSSPAEVSPFAPPLTNWQFALFAGANDDNGHFVAGFFDEAGVPTGLRYTDPRLWVDMIQAVPPYTAPNQAFHDWDQVMCDEVVVPPFDHLGEVVVPILYIGAGGSAGRAGFYNAGLTASKDITKIVVQLLPDDQHAYDYGHVDLFAARNAKQLVWRPILNWLLAHRPDRAYAAGVGR